MKNNLMITFLFFALNVFLTKVRDICMQKAVQLISFGSNDQIIEKFIQDSVKKEAYTLEEQAYMLGYFQNCLWLLQNRFNT